MVRLREPARVEVSMTEKMWGSEPFWGLGYEWDPDWVYTEHQKELRSQLIELCETQLRPNAKRFDDELMFPRPNLEILGEHGFLALTVPEEYGGLGENHVAYSMVCETIARYGCASTAMCYVMHMGAVNAIMLRATPELIDRYIRPVAAGKTIGTLSYSDPETGSHFWYPVSSGAERVNGGYKVRKKASWTTSGGFADFYVVQTTSPDFTGYDDLSVAQSFEESGRKDLNILSPRNAVLTLKAPLGAEETLLASIHYASPKPREAAWLQEQAARLAKGEGL
jgi:alkylation response protein AidB-like acyl-CoA dehydrogenase